MRPSLIGLVLIPLTGCISAEVLSPQIPEGARSALVYLTGPTGLEVVGYEVGTERLPLARPSGTTGAAADYFGCSLDALGLGVTLGPGQNPSGCLPAAVRKVIEGDPADAASIAVARTCSRCERSVLVELDAQAFNDVHSDGALLLDQDRVLVGDEFRDGPESPPLAHLVVKGQPSIPLSSTGLEGAVPPLSFWRDSADDRLWISDFVGTLWRGDFDEAALEIVATNTVQAQVPGLEGGTIAFLRVGPDLVIAGSEGGLYRYRSGTMTAIYLRPEAWREPHPDRAGETYSPSVPVALARLHQDDAVVAIGFGGRPTKAPRNADFHGSGVMIIRGAETTSIAVEQPTAVVTTRSLGTLVGTRNGVIMQLRGEALEPLLTFDGALDTSKVVALEVLGDSSFERVAAVLDSRRVEHLLDDGSRCPEPILLSGTIRRVVPAGTRRAIGLGQEVIAFYETERFPAECILPGALDGP